MEIRKVITGMLETNCYIVSENGQACVIDPGGDADKILSALEGFVTDKIILTHGHFDHFMAAGELKKATNAKIYISEKDAHMLTDYRKSLYDMLGIGSNGFESVEFDGFLESKIDICGETFEVIETPGHSEGSICLLKEKILFSGDTLFSVSIGRYDHGSYDEIMSSLWKLMLLDDDVNVLPGHGSVTTIGQERKTNPFLR
jgi:glyoxylase-like metal-dependent hydrolase (beta-lactamase superfamily II)